MNKNIFQSIALLLLIVPLAPAQSFEPSSLVEHVGDTGFVRVEVKSFDSLNARQQQLAYWLSQAAIASDPIVYDQFSRFGLRQKRLLEGILAHSGGIDAAITEKLTRFTKLFWANRGNHNETTSQKFLPTFSVEELRKAAHAALQRGAFTQRSVTLPPLSSARQLDLELNDLRASLFDANFEPMLTAKNPGPGQDIIQASSNTFYQNLALRNLEGFLERYPLNSRIVRGKDGTLREIVYRAGTPDGKVAAGLYAAYLKRVNSYLGKAARLADPVQAKVIADLIRYFQTGEYSDWLRFGTDWVQNDATVDFVNGFVEVYRDARSAKASSQAFVSITDKPLTQIMTRLATNAEYFEEKAPWDALYKKHSFKLPVVKAIETLVETGDFGVTTVGDNLPNENEIHEKYGTKNFLISSSTRALNKTSGHRAFNEFAATPQIAARNAKYGDEAEDLETALHEVIGHGSGKLGERTKAGPKSFLKEYYSTLEEARADLMALWNTWDPKLKELGLISDQQEVSKAMYDGAVMAPLMQLRRIPRGDTIEEDHERDRQLIVSFIRDRLPGAIEQFDHDGKTYYAVMDYPKMRQGVGILLTELMRIKAEGDYDAIKALADKYAVHFDPTLRDQVVARYEKLDLPAYWAGLNSILTAQFGKDGKIMAVHLGYPSSVEQQYLSYASMYDGSLLGGGEASR